MLRICDSTYGVRSTHSLAVADLLSRAIDLGERLEASLDEEMGRPGAAHYGYYYFDPADGDLL